MKNINNSIVAGRDVSNAINANDSEVKNVNNEILHNAKKISFWVSLITGIVSSLIASLIFHYFSTE